MANDPITDPLLDAPPKAMTDRLAYVQPNALATFRFPGDQNRPDTSRWFASGPGARPVRDGNEVMYLIDGPDTFAEMGRVMGTATNPTKHFIYILGWSLVLDFPFGRDGSTAGELLRQASDVRGVQVRAIAWAGFMGKVVSSLAAVQTINKMTNGQAFNDDRTLMFGSHHQKVVVVNGAEGLFAFCGGIDIDPNRVFPKGVNGSNFAGAPFHDVHCRIRGPAAWDVLQVFIERWSDFIMSGPRDEGMEIKQKAPLVGRGISLDAQPMPGRLHVSVARTYGKPGSEHGTICSWIGRNVTNETSPQWNTYSFAPGGEASVAQMFFQAIAAARRFIYLEDQYFVHLEAADALAKAIANLEHVTILFPASQLTDLPHIWEHRKEVVERLRKAGGSKARFFVRAPFGELVPHSYVHAKTWIFDDEFAIIGTANVNRRSWTHDSEIDVGIFDESTNDHASLTFAHRLRIRLWAEHLNMNSPDGHAQLADGVASAVHWTLPGTSVIPYDPDSGLDDLTTVPNKLPWDDVDPDGT
jgi:phosphatidylserine/phosphatidylglycerophosphate/cardiolipin synthase-like enzyme